MRHEIVVADRRNAAREARLRERGDDRLGAQAVRGGALARSSRICSRRSPSSAGRNARGLPRRWADRATSSRMLVSGPMEMVADIEWHDVRHAGERCFRAPRRTRQRLFPGHRSARCDHRRRRPAGLAAAAYLAEAGRTALVLEKRPILGGKLSSWRDRDGDVLETGLHSFFGGYDTVHALLRTVGIAHHVLWQPHTLTFAMPPGFSNRVGGSGGVREVPLHRRALAVQRHRRRAQRALRVQCVGESALRDRNAADSRRRSRVCRTAGRHHVRRVASARAACRSTCCNTFFAPMALALNFTPADKISAEAMLRVMAYFASSRDASRAGFLDGPPNERLIEPIAAHVRATRSAHRIDRARCRAAVLRRRLHRRAHDRRPHVSKPNNVILATPVHDAAKLLPAEMLRDPLVHGVGKLTSSPVINGAFLVRSSGVAAHESDFRRGHVAAGACRSRSSLAGLRLAREIVHRNLRRAGRRSDGARRRCASSIA